MGDGESQRGASSLSMKINNEVEIETEVKVICT